MTPQTGKQMVLVSVAVMGGAATIKGLGGSGSADSKFRRIWAVGALGLVLSIVADFAPQIAGPLAALTALGYAIGAEGAVTRFVSGAVGGAKVAQTASPSTPSGSGPGTTLGKGARG